MNLAQWAALAVAAILTGSIIIVASRCAELERLVNKMLIKVNHLDNLIELMDYRQAGLGERIGRVESKMEGKE